jgi:hypothetical protein
VLKDQKTKDERKNSPRLVAREYDNEAIQWPLDHSQDQRYKSQRIKVRAK